MPHLMPTERHPRSNTQAEAGSGKVNSLHPSTTLASSLEEVVYAELAEYTADNNVTELFLADQSIVGCVLRADVNVRVPNAIPRPAHLAQMITT